MNTTRSSQGLFILAKVRKAPIKKAQSKLSTATKKDNYFMTVGNTTIKFY